MPSDSINTNRGVITVAVIIVILAILFLFTFRPVSTTANAAATPSVIDITTPSVIDITSTNIEIVKTAGSFALTAPTTVVTGSTNIVVTPTTADGITTYALTAPMTTSASVVVTSANTNIAVTETTASGVTTYALTAQTPTVGSPNIQIDETTNVSGGIHYTLTAPVASVMSSTPTHLTRTVDTTFANVTLGLSNVVFVGGNTDGTTATPMKIGSSGVAQNVEIISNNNILITLGSDSTAITSSVTLHCIDNTNSIIRIKNGDAGDFFSDNAYADRIITDNNTSSAIPNRVYVDREIDPLRFHRAKVIDSLLPLSSLNLEHDHTAVTYPVLSVTPTEFIPFHLSGSGQTSFTDTADGTRGFTVTTDATDGLVFTGTDPILGGSNEPLGFFEIHYSGIIEPHATLDRTIIFQCHTGNSTPSEPEARIRGSKSITFVPAGRQANVNCTFAATLKNATTHRMYISCNVLENIVFSDFEVYGKEISKLRIPYPP